MTEPTDRLSPLVRLAALWKSDSRDPSPGPSVPLAPPGPGDGARWPLHPHLPWLCSGSTEDAAGKKQNKIEYFP